METKPIVYKQSNRLLSFYNHPAEIVVWFSMLINVVTYTFYIVNLFVQKIIGIKPPDYVYEQWFINLFNYIIFFADPNCLSLVIITLYCKGWKRFSVYCLVSLWVLSFVNFIKITFDTDFDPYVVFSSCVIYAGVLTLVFAKITNRF